MTVKYVLWKRLKSSGWTNEFVFQFEGHKITGMAPAGWNKGLAEINWKTATLLTKAKPMENVLEELDEAAASVAIMETEIVHHKNVLEVGLPVGTYFILWSKDEPENMEEVAYGRVTKSLGDLEREAVILGLHRRGDRPVDEKVTLEDGRRAFRSSDLRLGDLCRLSPMDVLHVSKDEIRILRKVEPDDWSHKPDQDLDLSSRVETEFRRA